MEKSGSLPLVEFTSCRSLTTARIKSLHFIFSRLFKKKNPRGTRSHAASSNHDGARKSAARMRCRNCRKLSYDAGFLEHPHTRRLAYLFRPLQIPVSGFTRAWSMPGTSPNGTHHCQTKRKSSSLFPLLSPTRPHLSTQEHAAPRETNTPPIGTQSNDPLNAKTGRTGHCTTYSWD